MWHASGALDYYYFNYNKYLVGHLFNPFLVLGVNLSPNLRPRFPPFEFQSFCIAENIRISTRHDPDCSVNTSMEKSPWPCMGCRLQGLVLLQIEKILC